MFQTKSNSLLSLLNLHLSSLTLALYPHVDVMLLAALSGWAPG